MNKIENFIEQHYNIIIVLILIIAFFTRIIFLDKIPNAMHVDEAGIMYDSYCFANYGVDRYLYRNPVYLINFGGGQSILYTLIASVFVKLFGYKLFWIRLPAMLFSIIYIITAYFIVKKFESKKLAILIAFLITIVPWNFTLSRYALDCNLMSSFMLIGIAVLLNANKKWQYAISGIIFGITLYTYILSLIILPVFLILISLYLLYIKKAKIADIVVLAIPIIIFVIPLLLFLLYNKGSIEISGNTLLSYPKLVSFRTNEMSIKNVGNNILNILISFFTINIDFTVGDGTNIFGGFYHISRIFFLIGIVITIIKIRTNIIKKQLSLDIFFLIILSSALGLLFIKDIYIYKVNAIIISFIYYTAKGIEVVTKEWKKSLIPIISLYIILFIGFEIYYFTIYPRKISNELCNSSISNTISYVEKNFKNDKIYMACFCVEPYIFQLAENPISPYEFNRTKEYIDYKIEKYDKYSFNNYYEDVNENMVYIIKKTPIYENHKTLNRLRKKLLENYFQVQEYQSHGEVYNIYYKEKLIKE